jgi:hypothetical protein
MSELHEFEHQIQHKLADDSRTPHWTPEEAKQYIFDVGVRRQRFEHLASHLVETVIRPRLEVLGTYFPVADLIEDEPPHHCTCWIGHSERFPATTKIVFAVEHDLRHETIDVCYETRMLPAIVKFNNHGTLSLAFDEVDDATVANWVEKRLLEFLDAYLRIDSGGGPIKPRRRD